MKQFTHILFILGTFFLLTNFHLPTGFTITGKVKDGITGEGLIGAEILEKGTKNGVVTDIEGNYTITVANEKATLVISYVGYKTEEVFVNGKNNIEVLLTEGVTTDEVLIVGYEVRPISKDKTTTGKTITAEEVKSIPSKKRIKRPRKTSAAAPRAESEVKVRGSRSPADVVYVDGIKVAESASMEKATIASISESSSISKDAGYDNSLKAGTLTAGEINDFSKWKLWQDIEKTDLGGYQKSWNMNLMDRYTIQLMNKKGLPIIDAEVQIFNQDKEILWTSRSDNTGKAELWLNIFKKQNATKLYAKVSYNGETHTIKQINTFHNGINTLVIDEPCQQPGQVDVMFVVDATGSMSDEINYLKVELKDVIENMQTKNEDLTINLGSVFYRDVTDAYLTRESDFSDNIDQTIKFIGMQGAGGGGDTPEAVDAALEVAIDSMNWSENAVARLLFLVLDAPPHQNADVLAKLERLTQKAAEKGIRIIPITGSGIDKSTEYLMRSLALSTNGTYVFLTDDSGVGGAHIKPTTDKYDVETLNELLVRLYVQYTQTPVCEGDQVFAMNDNDDNDDNSDNTDEPEPNDNTDEPVEVFSFKYYPNPCRGQLTIELEAELDECFITDASGKIIQRHANLQAGQTPIDLTGFPSGIYFIRYMKDKKAATKKLILMR